MAAAKRESDIDEDQDEHTEEGITLSGYFHSGEIIEDDDLELETDKLEDLDASSQPWTT